MFIPKIVGALALLDRRAPTQYGNGVPDAPGSSTTVQPPTFTQSPPPPIDSTSPNQPPSHENTGAPNCANPRVRKEWRSFSSQQQQDYISAVQCLKSLPPKGKDMFPVVTSRFEDFVVTHYNHTFDEFDWNGSKQFFGDSDIHANGQFLPWHRYFLWQYESALINECGYKGAQPYWEWSQDVQDGSWGTSKVFDSASGFGGNGVGDDHCLQDGPFAAAGANLDPGPPTNTVITGSHRCFHRELRADIATGGLNWNKNVMPLINAESYQDFSAGMESNQADDYKSGQSKQKFGIHPSGHLGVGGEMADTMVSPADPLFYLHHANIDRVWWMWQNKKPENVMAIGWKIFFKKSGYEVDMTLDSVLDMYPFLAPNVPARKVMDPLNRDGQGVMCYVYEKGAFDVPWAVAGQ
jgi:tyrosinase